MWTNICEFFRRQWRENKNILLFFLFVVVPVKSSLADWNWVPSGSMNPTILEGDLVYVNKLAYDLRVPLTLHSAHHISNPERGDISVLFQPEEGTRLVKRVIGVPGDTVELINNRLIVNGQTLDYSPLPEEVLKDLNAELRALSDFALENLGHHTHAVMQTPGIPTNNRNHTRVTVPEGHYFVLGDNRDNSLDSRSFGFVERKLFVGEATHVIGSLNILDKFQPRMDRFFTELQ